MEKLLPQSIEAETGVLGSIIIDPDAYTLVADFLDASDFYRDAHRTLYEVIVHLAASGEPADFIMLCDELERRNQLKDVGGASYITSLINGVPTSGHVEYYGHIVHKKANLRRLIHAAGKIAANAYAEDDDALQQAEQTIFQIGQKAVTSDFASGVSVLDAVFRDLDHLHLHQGDITGVPTGFHDLDNCLGGLQRSDLIIAAGRPGMGKTSWALNVAYNAMKQDKRRVAIFSLEMSNKQLMQRMLSMETGIDSQCLRNGRLSEKDWHALVVARDLFADLPVWIDDTGGLSMAAMRSRARRLKAEHDIDLIIVDYLQLMQAHQNGKRIEPRLQEIQEVSGGLKALAKEIDVPVLALAQLSRAVEGRTLKVPQLSDLRESGSIENDADVVMFLYRDDYYAGYNLDGSSKSNRPGTADVIVAKHRNGPTGEITLQFAAPQTRFFNSYDEQILAYGKDGG